MKRQVVSGVLLLALAVALLGLYRAAPDESPGALEAAIDRFTAENRRDVWPEVRARVIASERVGERMYVAFVNEAEREQLYGAILRADRAGRWHGVYAVRFLGMPVGSFPSYTEDGNRHVVVGTGAVGRYGITRYTVEMWFPALPPGAEGDGASCEHLGYHSEVVLDEELDGTPFVRVVELPEMPAGLLPGAWLRVYRQDSEDGINCALAGAAVVQYGSFNETGVVFC